MVVILLIFRTPSSRPAVFRKFTAGTISGTARSTIITTRRLIPPSRSPPPKLDWVRAVAAASSGDGITGAAQTTIVAVRASSEMYPSAVFGQQRWPSLSIAPRQAQVGDVKGRQRLPGQIVVPTECSQCRHPVSSIEFSRRSSPTRSSTALARLQHACSRRVILSISAAAKATGTCRLPASAANADFVDRRHVDRFQPPVVRYAFGSPRNRQPMKPGLDGPSDDFSRPSDDYARQMSPIGAQ